MTRLSNRSADSTSIRTKSAGLLRRGQPCYICYSQPMGADQHQHHIAGADFLLQHAHEVLPGADAALDIHKQAFGGKGLLEPAKQHQREPRRVLSPVTEEDFARHLTASRLAGRSIAQGRSVR
jgi:hypothetical protein